MRLNRRKNRASKDDRKRASGRAEKSRSKEPGEERKRRRARKRPQERKRRRNLAARGKALRRAALSVGADVFGVARELVRWPARIWMRTAEGLGGAILTIWRRAIVPALRAVRRALAAALAYGERTVTPARGLAVVALAATIALGGSQFGDYRAVEVGKPSYAAVEDVAPAPQVQQAMPRSAHGAWVFAIAVACLFVTVFAVWRNWRLARLLLFGGLAVVAISLFVDRPDGLELGTAGEAYAGAHAVLLGPFWAQLFAGVTLAVVGPLLAAQLRAERGTRRRRSKASGEERKRRSRRAPRLRPGVGT